MGSPLRGGALWGALGEPEVVDVVGADAAFWFGGAAAAGRGGVELVGDTPPEVDAGPVAGGVAGAGAVGGAGGTSVGAGVPGALGAVLGFAVGAAVGSGLYACLGWSVPTCATLAATTRAAPTRTRATPTASALEKRRPLWRP